MIVDTLAKEKMLSASADFIEIVAVEDEICVFISTQEIKDAIS